MVDGGCWERTTNKVLHFEVRNVGYIEFWNNRLQTAMRLSKDVLNQIVAMTDSFSFAYLKQLFLSSMIRWMGTMEGGAMEKIMIYQVAILGE